MMVWRIEGLYFPTLSVNAAPDSGDIPAPGSVVNPVPKVRRESGGRLTPAPVLKCWRARVKARMYALRVG